MLKLSPRGPKYVVVTIGTKIFHDNTTSIKCSVCGNICEGRTQQNQIEKLFDCLSKHIPAEHLYEVYEMQDNNIVTEMDQAVWNKAKKDTKYKP